MIASTNLFIYGTLLDGGILARVLNCQCRILPATLNGFRAVYVRGQNYPGLVRKAGAVADGGVIQGLNALQIEQLQFFEGDGYQLIDVAPTVRGASLAAVTFVPVLADVLTTTPWDLGDWRRRHKANFIDRFFR